MADVGTSSAPAASGAARFTEAIPLSLSSMAHTALPLEDGLLDGLKNTIQHTLWSSLSYARKAFGQNYSPVDLSTSAEAWKPTKLTDPSPEDAIPSNLRKQHGFNHVYQRTALVYLRPAMNTATTAGDWTEDPAALARINFLYAATDEMTPEELKVAEYESEDAMLAKKQKAKKKKGKKRSAEEISSETNNGDEDAVPPPPKHVVLYKATVEYRSLPATGNKNAVAAEELSMLSFGGSLVDDDVKYGALASLYDDNAKYVLEILGVRGKKYRLDLMDATLSDGTVPMLPSRSSLVMVGREVNRRGRNGGAVIPTDPFVKRLCVAVTDHEPSTKDTSKPTVSEEEKKTSASGASDKNPPYSMTTMRLSLEGGLRIPHLLNATDLPAPNFYPSQIEKAFLSLRSTNAQPNIVTSMPSGHRLLLDPSEAGKVYIHGRYVTTWGKDPRIGGAMNCTALFGMDLHSVPYWHGRIADYDQLMVVYATLWTEILTDAKLISKNIGGLLLSRLITGHDPIIDDEDSEEDSDEDSDDDSDSDDEEEEPATMRLNTDMNCLESQVMSSSQCDPVGISAKALATKFQNEYAMEGYPCLAHEIDWVKDRLPGRVPVVVPQRLISVLRRGGFFDIKRTSEEVWFSESRTAKEGTDEEAIVTRTCELLTEAKCNDVKPSSIVFGGNVDLDNPVQKKGLVRINRLLRQYHVNESFLTMDLQQLASGEDTMDEDTGKEETEESKNKRIEALAMILGMHIAREHPDGNVAMRYMLQHMVKN